MSTMPQAGLVWPAWLDIRALIVSIGVLIVVADVLVRRMHRDKAVAAPAGAEAPLPQPDQVIRTLRSRPEKRVLPATWRPAQRRRLHRPWLRSLPDRPSIVVLPFANMSRDLEQEYFSDGITEDIITDLSKVSGLVRHRPQLGIRLQGPGSECSAGVPGPRSPLCPGRQHSQVGQPGTRYGAADRRLDRGTSLGRALRPRSHRYLRGPG